MKTLITVLATLALAGCATGPQSPRDPSQWRVVSVTPVPAGTAARIAAASPDGNAVEYSSRALEATPPAYLSAPAVPRYGPAPLYAPPYVQQPSYYWPPVSLSLGFVFGRHWGGGRHHRGYRHR